MQLTPTFSYYVGQMAATGMMVSTGTFQSELSWRLPLYIQVCFIKGGMLNLGTKVVCFPIDHPRRHKCALHLLLP